MASLDIKSLYTNIPIMKCLNILRSHPKKSKEKLPLPIHKIIKICKLITNHCFFSFNIILYKQTFGLPMGSPIRSVLACLFLEFLESGPFRYIISNSSTYLSYIDDVHLLNPQDTNLLDILMKFNKVVHTNLK